MATGTIPYGKTLYYGPNANTYMQALTTNNVVSCSVLWREGSYYCVELSSPYRRLYIAQSDVNVYGTVIPFNPSGGTRYITSENYDFRLGPGTYYSFPPAKVDFPFSVTFLGKKEGDYALIEYTHSSYPRKFRAWFYSNALATAPREPGNYAHGHLINYEGDEWNINNTWASNSANDGHLGVDVNRLNASGVPINYKNVYAVADGTVVNAQNSGSANGNCVIIEHTLSNNLHYYSTYCHLNSIAVSENEDVRAGQVIGVMGETGNATGVHVHIHITKTNAGVNAYGYNRDSDGDYCAFSAGNFKDIEYGLRIRYFNPVKFFENGSQFISEYYDAPGSSG